jgi:cobalt/nickel transport system ATP-binding protein
MSHHPISVLGLSYAYPDGTAALDDVSFDAGHGEAIAVIGANGAGKSTLLLHLNGLLEPAAGEVRIGGIPVVKSTLPQIRRTVGMLFQDPDDQLFMPTVGEDVGFGPLNLGLPPAEVEARVVEALGRVGVTGLKERPPYRLSGGEKRAVAIATVLAMEPSVLVMDEPSGGLDPRARRRLIGLLRGFEHTRIIATHDLDLALELCERTIVLSHGAVVADGATAAILHDEPLLRDSGLEPPLSLRPCPVCGAVAAGPDASRPLNATRCH